MAKVLEKLRLNLRARKGKVDETYTFKAKEKIGPYEKDKLFAPKKTGQLEPGARKASAKDLDKIDIHDVKPPTKPGDWDKSYDLSNDNLINDLNSFSETPKSDTLAPGTKLYRFIDSERGKGGSYWILEKDLPKTEAEWRSKSAVKNGWNGDGAVAEYEVGKDGLNVWRGPAAMQKSDVDGYVLDGGGEQIWVPRGTIEPSTVKPSPWNGNY
jgi:hypothetical protein